MKVIVVASGEPAASDGRELDGADLLIGADGGARWLVEEAGRAPDLVVGDLDSASPELVARLEAAGTRIERHPVEKAASDAELAVEAALAAGADEVVVLGAFGGRRLDHGLANVLLLADPQLAGRGVRLVHGGTRVRVLHAGERAGLDGQPGDLVTLLPVGGGVEGVVTDGLRYPLDGEPLRIGRSRGLSNVVERAPASVAVGRGTLLVVESREGS